MGSISHITPLVINSLRGRHTHTHTQTHTHTHTNTHTDIRGQSNSKKRGRVKLAYCLFATSNSYNMGTRD